MDWEQVHSLYRRSWSTPVVPDENIHVKLEGPDPTHSDHTRQIETLTMEVCPNEDVVGSRNRVSRTKKWVVVDFDNVKMEITLSSQKIKLWKGLTCANRGKVLE